MKRLRTPSPDGVVRAPPVWELPAWYYCSTAFTIDEDREVYPEVFGADLLHIDDVNESSERDSDSMDANCECGLRVLNASVSYIFRRGRYLVREVRYYRLRDDREKRKRDI
ncbi:hypothetical protein PCL_07261 [Purpureocillium lilacinum]|uniref:Uncharacterized protein n=1 Tax=Purpureocillium lilacinum TaxID=33203 RepID=A0A2U3DSH1_PURLI|nr:hypothetical protein PCL_07261 [Purpureocillium lilacinum]